MSAIATLSVAISATATIIAGCFALPGALWIVYGRSRLRSVVLLLFTVGLGLPPVAVGLAVAFAFWRSGVMGALDLLYTPAAMGIAQTIIVLPLVGSLAVLALRASDTTLPMQLAGLELSRKAQAALLAREVAPGLAAALLAGFGRAIAEVGAAQMTGGNIEGQTRVLTTATMLAVDRGDFGTASSYVLVLLGIMCVVSGAVMVLQRKWS